MTVATSDLELNHKEKLRLKRTAFYVPSLYSPEIIKVAGGEGLSDGSDIMAKAGYEKINALDIANSEQIFEPTSGLACNNLYLKGDTFYVWLAWEVRADLTDKSSGNLLIYKFGELI